MRLRLERGEVDRLREQACVTATTAFAGGINFSYGVESSSECERPAATFANNSIVVRLPEATVKAWADSEQVSIDGKQPLDNGEVLSILVEKDFACLAPREGEDEADMFPHPQADDDSVSC